MVRATVPFVPLALSLLASCASSYMRPATPIGAPGPGEAKIVVYRRSILGSAITFPVYHGDKLIGFAEKGGYFEYKCAPGKIVLTTWAENDQVAAGELLPGKTYYIRSYAKMGFFSAASGLDPVHRDDSEWADIEKIVGELECREVDPEKAVKHEASRRDTARRILAEYEKGEEEAAVIRSDDGK